jgi:glyceraldehyde 3-phosphate dehydrogenase
MTVRIGINGFGRMGRLGLRPLVETGRDDVVPLAVNDLGSVEANAHLLCYDSVHGRFPGQVEVAVDAITIHYRDRSYGPIRVSAEKDPTKLPFQGVDLAMECTGHFTKRETAAQLIKAGNRKVLVSPRLRGQMRPSSMA